MSCVERDILRHFDQFLKEMDQVTEPGGSLLDHTTVVMGSNFGDSSNHTCQNLPTLVAGGGIAHQQHRVLEAPTPLCNLWLELLHRHDIDVDRFGSSVQDMQLLAN